MFNGDTAVTEFILFSYKEKKPGQDPASSKSLVYNLEVALAITFLAVVGLIVFFVSRRKKAKTNILLVVDGIPLSYDGEYLTWQTTD